MFESFGRGFRMIWASIKMGWQDKRLLLPSILTVFTNIMFGILMVVEGLREAHANKSMHSGESAMPTTHGLIHHAGVHGHLPDLVGMAGINGPLDQSGLQGGLNTIGGFLTSEATIGLLILAMVWWMTNRFLEGVTTALVYTNLTEGKGTGKFSQACAAVFSSLPAIFMLGLVTFIAKRLAGFLRSKNTGGTMGFGFNFLAGIVEIFWTLAGHLILPAIVVEGTSFWGGLKRADKIASGNLLTIGIGEVGVDAICRITTVGLYALGTAGFGYSVYAGSLASPMTVVFGVFWAALVIVVTALSIYIRAAFYTCLYAWAIDSEAVQATDRTRVRPRGPLASALA